MSEQLLLNARQLGELLNVSERTAYRLIYEHRLPGVVHIGSCTRIRRDLVTEWLEANTEPVPEQVPCNVRQIGA